jgi:adenine-specific DNA glycosylase
LEGETKVARQRKREIHYALDYRHDAVFLARRARDARLMAGMWELPEVAGSVIGARKQQIPRFARNDKKLRNEKTDGNGRAAEMYGEYFTVRHSITVTDYRVRVWRMNVPSGVDGEWVAVERLTRIALTGLARKILRKAEIIVPIRSADRVI